jgi:tRNA pseudouridine55 synthase
VIPDEGGVLLIDKPAGPTSHDCVAHVRRALRTRRVGHTGTLDPFATGLLVVCVGPATRISQWLTHLDKSYEAEIELGRTTETLDPEGETLSRIPGCERLDRSAIDAALSGFLGEQLQRPPAYSAKKIGGVAAHRRVRRGESVELAPVPVTISALDVLEWTPPRLRVRVDCSSGTYIRAIARDLGEATGFGGMLTALRRLSVGGFRLEGAVSLEALESDGEISWVRPAEALRLAGIPGIDVDAAQMGELAQGRPVERPSAEPVLAEGSSCALVHEGRLCAIAEVRGERLQPRRVFVSVAPESGSS